MNQFWCLFNHQPSNFQGAWTRRTGSAFSRFLCSTSTRTIPWLVAGSLGVLQRGDHLKKWTWNQEGLVDRCGVEMAFLLPVFFDPTNISMVWAILDGKSKKSLHFHPGTSHLRRCTATSSPKTNPAGDRCCSVPRSGSKAVSLGLVKWGWSKNGVDPKLWPFQTMINHGTHGMPWGFQPVFQTPIVKLHSVAGPPISQAFLHMGAAPMTPVLADFLTKLGWSGICVGPMKPPPGNEAGNGGPKSCIYIYICFMNQFFSKGNEFILSENIEFLAWHFRLPNSCFKECKVSKQWATFFFYSFFFGNESP